MGIPNTYNDVLFDGHFAEAWYYDWGTGQAPDPSALLSDDGRAAARPRGSASAILSKHSDHPVDQNGAWDDVDSNLAFLSARWGPL